LQRPRTDAAASRRRFTQWLLASSLGTGALGHTALHAQDNKPLRIVVPFAPGGSNDIVGRSIAQQLTSRLKRSVIVENRPGAGGAMGTELVARAEPDGNTLVLISSTYTMNASIMKLSYDPVKSFIPVAMLGMGPSVIAVAADLPVNSIKELVEYSKKNAGKVFFGSAGVASFQHFAIELFMQRSGAVLSVVHYKGGGPALVDVMSGEVDVTMLPISESMPYVRDGRVIALGQTGVTRSTIAPRACATHWPSRTACPRSWPTASSACTSTRGRSTTAPPDAWPCGRSSIVRPTPVFFPVSKHLNSWRAARAEPRRYPSRSPR
jgi:tripartite-type tricarboxylate transporter receptor subunit TctC